MLLLGQFGPSVEGERRRKISEVLCSPVKPLTYHLKSTIHPLMARRKTGRSINDPEREEFLEGST